jgi:hypothetical protein
MDILQYLDKQNNIESITNYEFYEEQFKFLDISSRQIVLLYRKKWYKLLENGSAILSRKIFSHFLVLLIFIHSLLKSFQKLLTN